MCVCVGRGGCLDTYISATTWLPQTKISSFAPDYP